MTREQDRPESPTVLLLEDDEGAASSLARWLGARGFEPTIAGTLAEARRALGNAPFDLVILDREVPDGDGIDLLRGGETGDADVIVLTGHVDVEIVVEAIQIGALDYLEKPVDLDRLRERIERVEARRRRRSIAEDARRQVERSGRFGPLVGRSPAMQALYEKVCRVAPTDATVFLVGETGTGKDLVARTVHRFSRRSEGPFVAVNCGALPQTLVESELFGHEKGAFTGAHRSRAGVFVRASGGTLFLDEISEMPLELQTRLLRVLENRQVTPVGGADPIEVDVRVIAATNRDPREAVAAERLREDLLFRLLVFPIELPPLRERPEDIDLLVDAFLERAAEDLEAPLTFSAELRAQLRAHRWPGNVRELRNAVERLVILRADDFEPDPYFEEEGGAPKDRLPIRPGMTVAEAERVLIEATLERTRGDKREAAGMLGISLKTLYNRLRAYDRSDDG